MCRTKEEKAAHDMSRSNDTAVQLQRISLILELEKTALSHPQLQSLCERLASVRTTPLLSLRTILTSMDVV